MVDLERSLKLIQTLTITLAWTAAGPRRER
jgi:hypothetical protein